MNDIDIVVPVFGGVMIEKPRLVNVWITRSPQPPRDEETTGEAAHD